MKNKILIIDEVQNMVSEYGTYYNKLYDIIHKAPRDLRIVLLSATPIFDKPIEIALTMNLVRIPYEFPTGREFEKIYVKTIENKRTGKVKKIAQNMTEFKERIKGYISYFRGAPEYTFPKSIIKYVKCEMSDFQYRSYITVLQKEEKKSGLDKKKIYHVFTKGQIRDLPNNFFIGTRIISNIAYPNKNIGDIGFQSFEGNELQMNNLQKYSIKFYKIMKKIEKSFGKIFVYSGFRAYGGIKSFIKVLEYHGYKNYDKFGEGKKRFAIMSGEESREYKDEVKALYNQTINNNGSKLKIILASPALREGWSFTSIQQMHILEPYWNNARLEQIIGRAIRYCSHKNIEEDKRLVKVYIYMATHPYESITVDEYIKNMARKKNKLIEGFYTAMKESAIDCDLFSNANKSSTKELICSK
jgi:SNF2 family DNA or RNA helicase